MKLLIVLFVIFPLIFAGEQKTVKYDFMAKMATTKSVLNSDRSITYTSTPKNDSTIKSDRKGDNYYSPTRPNTLRPVSLGEIRRDACTCQACLLEPDNVSCQRCFVCYNNAFQPNVITGVYDCQCNHGFSVPYYNINLDLGFNCYCKESD